MINNWGKCAPTLLNWQNKRLPLSYQPVGTNRAVTSATNFFPTDWLKMQRWKKKVAVCFCYHFSWLPFLPGFHFSIRPNARRSIVFFSSSIFEKWLRLFPWSSISENWFHKNFLFPPNCFYHGKTGVWASHLPIYFWHNLLFVQFRRGGARFLCAEKHFPRIKSVPSPLLNSPKKRLCLWEAKNFSESPAQWIFPQTDDNFFNWFHCEFENLESRNISCVVLYWKFAYGFKNDRWRHWRE